MSLKGLFQDVTVTKTVADKSAEQIGGVVESARYHLADIVDEKRFIPRIDYSEPKNFAKYGSAEKYYEDSFSYIYSSYPYDGSLYEQIEWKNSGSYLDIYLFEDKYPRTHGYINFSYGGWGTHGTAPAWPDNAGYGKPQTSDLEHISIEGGPGLGGGPHNQGANIWDPAEKRKSNLELDLSNGVTVEFWLKKEAYNNTDTEKEVIFDLWNNELSSSADYGRLRIELTGAARSRGTWLATVMSGTTGFQWQTIGTTPTGTVADGKWHHYAFSFLSASDGVDTKYYIDGDLETNTTLGSTGIDSIGGDMLAYIGALRTSVSGNTYFGLDMTGSGKLSASLDEFRYWKIQRSSKDIGRYWFTQVGGGTNTDVANTDLGVYYKFNEGITGKTSTDSVVLDYSGRVSNGAWEGYASGARSTGSAIIESSASAIEFKDPIIYSFHPDVQAELESLKLSGSAHDFQNPSRMLGFFPSWIQESDIENGGELTRLTQVLSSYFDTLYLQIESMSNLQDIQYVSGSTKPNTIANRLLEHRGLLAPELFLDADILEKLADRSEDKLYEESLTDIKNSIYQNIYNNLVNIFKSKGTRKSFRNLLRCFGVDDEIYKFNVYGNNVEFQVRNNRELNSVKKRFIDFNNTERFASTVFQQTSSLNSNTVSYISGSSALTGGYATTLETYVFFPEKPKVYDEGYSDSQYKALSSSLFGQHTTIPFQDSDPTNLTWNTLDTANFQVYAVRDELFSKDVKFVLTTSLGSSFPTLSSSYFADTYENTNWVLGVTVKPQKYPLEPTLSTDVSASGEYVVEFKGSNVDAGAVLGTFLVTGTIDPAQVGYSFLTESRRVYVGAHRTNFTGSALTKTDVRIGFCRYWMDDITLEGISTHAMDIQNYGTKYPSMSPYLFQDVRTSNIEFKSNDTLALNWDFEIVSSSNAAGQFVVDDFSSGSTTIQATRYGPLGNLLGAQHSALGFAFPTSSTDVIDADYVLAAELQSFEHISSTDMISIVGAQDDVQFTRESRPINFKFSIEKSMYQNISENMVRMFSVINDFNNIVGDPVNKYRDSYKNLRILRNKFFESVRNTPDLDKYIEFYKWFDSSLSALLQQLMPATADFSKNIKTMVESHMLERNKYQHRFPTIDLYPADFEGVITSPLPLSPGWQFTHHPINNQENTNANWWKTMAPRDKGRLATGEADLDATRQKTFDNTTSKDRKDKKSNIFRFNVRAPASPSGPAQNLVIVQPAGTNFHPSKLVNYVFEATQPYGPTLVASNIPRNIILGFSGGVEKLPDIVDDINPGAKKRLGFALDPTINKKDLVDPAQYNGNVIAPFSLYSSSVNTGYNKKVQNFYASGTMVTNLHEDIVHTNATRPLQGPFTERFVGGRNYRHVPLNRYDESRTTPSFLDYRTTRPEGFRIDFGAWNFSGALGIVPPNYPFLDSPPGSAPKGFLKDLPIANRLRNVGTKRPVNIGNILMTTASADVRVPGTLAHGPIGNYTKNYQVVQTAGRTINDPYFQRQSFDFASYPQSPYPRLPIVDRHALQDIRVRNTKATYLTSSACYDFDADLVPEMDTNSAETWIFWMNCTQTGSLNFVFADEGADERYILLSNTQLLAFRAFWTDGGSVAVQWNTDAAVTTGNEWVHVAITYDGTSTANNPVFYVNGEEVASSLIGSPPVGTLDPYEGVVNIGFHNGNGFKGYMSDIAFYNTNLTGEEIAAIYGNSTLDLINYGPPRVANNLIMWWRMGDGPGDTVSTIIDQVGNANLDSVNSPTINDISPGVCLVTANDNNFALPNRDGANSNQTVFVNRFSAPGSYEASSRGYLDPAHEEKSVYNVLPYRNLGVLNYGLSGSASADPTVVNSIVVVDQIGKNRGLRQRLSLHCGPYGSDAAYGSVPADTYVTVPSYHKVYRNRKRQIVEGNSYVTASVYDNWYVRHPIPRSARQYSWITASLDEASANASALLFGYSTLSGGVFVESLPTVTASDWVTVTAYPACQHPELRFFGTDKTSQSPLSLATYPRPLFTDFVGLNSNIYEPITSSTNTLGYPRMEVSLQYNSCATANLYRVNYYGGLISGYPGSAPDDGRYVAPTLNAILLHRQGPYGWPSWKQIKTGDHPVRRHQNARSTISVRTKTAYDENVYAKKGNAITQFIEPAAYSEEMPMVHTMRVTPSDGGPAFDATLKSSFGNKIVNYATYELDNLLETNKDYDSSDLYFNRINSMIFEGTNNDPAFEGMLSNIGAVYAQRVYPAAYNSFLKRTNARGNYSISAIWDDSRANRNSGPSGFNNSQGRPTPSASVWPLDGHSNYSSTASLAGYDGSGELQNNYFKYASGSVSLGRAFTSASVIYAARLPLGLNPATDGAVFGGDQYYEVASMAGKDPYMTYEEYSHKMRLIGRDYSIVPEFRISEHMDRYIDDDSSEFTTLTDIADLLDLTGSLYDNSGEEGFFQDYANSDFMKFFKIVNSEYDGAQLVDGSKMKQSKIGLRCFALLKFLPYKGFYPAERTLELASLFSQSYGSYMNPYTWDWTTPRDILVPYPRSYRAMVEPLFGPGILFNTIKSGIAVSNVMLLNTASTSPGDIMKNDELVCRDIEANALVAPEGNIYYPNLLGRAWHAEDEVDVNEKGYYMEQLPFEALYKPRAYLTKKYIYDIAVHPSASLYVKDYYRGAHVYWPGEGSQLYELAIDNFMCETVDFFQQGLTTLTSKTENYFGEVQSGSAYTMTLKMIRPMLVSSSIGPDGRWHGTTVNTYTSGCQLIDHSKFDMYRRISAFGQPLAGVRSPGGGPPVCGNSALRITASFSHLTPSYFMGSGSATFTFAAPYTGRPTLGEILANTTITFDRMELSVLSSGVSSLPVHLSNSFNLMDIASNVVPGTTTETQQWVIQSKFETPVINLAGVTASVRAPTTKNPAFVTDNITPANLLTGSGLWHQYGSIPKPSETVYTYIEEPLRNSLADIVGMPAGVPYPLGDIKRSKQIFEAVVAVPFLLGKDGRRKFYKLSAPPLGRGPSSTILATISKLAAHMKKYVFPPRFDFVINKEMDPVAMYVFEFNADLTQQDLADIWQNLPPTVNETFVAREVEIEHELLVDELLNRTTRPITEDLRWLVFKVKQRAQKDYTRYVKRGLVTDLSTIPSNIRNASYSYNWPYDYFSLVELVKIDEAIEYTSEKPPDNTTQIVGDVNVVIPDVLQVDVVGGDPPGSGPGPLPLEGLNEG